MRLVSLTLLALLGSACASAPDGVAAHPFVGRFADALAFVPHGMDSIWLTDVRSVERPGWPRHSHLELRCGRDLESSRSWESLRHRQTFAGVIVEDHGSAGVPATRRDTLGSPAEPCDGRPVWHRPERTEGLDQIVPATWATIVDERFVVIADTEGLLREALGRPRGDVVTTMLNRVEVPPDAVDTVFHRFSGIRSVESNKPVAEWTALLVATQPPRLEVWTPMESRWPPSVGGNAEPQHRLHGATHVWAFVPEGGTTADIELAWWWTLATAFGLVILI